MDSIYFEKLMRLLTDALYNSWPGPGEGRSFAVFADVGLFPEPKQTPLAPDVMLSLDVPREGTSRARRTTRTSCGCSASRPTPSSSSSRIGAGGKPRTRCGSTPASASVTTSFSTPKTICVPECFAPSTSFTARINRSNRPGSPGSTSGFKLWEGEFEGERSVWLRWCDREGTVIPTGGERALLERQKAVEAEDRAERERKRAERLAEQLRSLGVEPPADA